MRMTLRYRKAVLALFKAQGTPDFVKNSDAFKAGLQDDELNTALFEEARAQFCTSIEALTSKIAMCGVLELELDLLKQCQKTMKKTIKSSSKSLGLRLEQTVEDSIFEMLQEGAPSTIIEQIGTIKQGIPFMENTLDEMVESGALMELSLIHI